MFSSAKRDAIHWHRAQPRERLKNHHAGGGKRTKNQRPLWLVCHEQALKYSEALAREAFSKSGQGREWLVRQQTVSPQASPTGGKFDLYEFDCSNFLSPRITQFSLDNCAAHLFHE